MKKFVATSVAVAGVCVVLMASADAAVSTAEKPSSHSNSGSASLKLELSNLIQAAQLKNPDILAAKADWLAYKKRIGASWALPDPMVGMDLMGAMTETRVGPEDQRFMFSQQIPFPLKLWEKRGGASDEAKAAYLRYAGTLRDVILKLRYAYYDFYLADASLETLSEVQDLLSKFERVAQTRYSNLSGPERDVAKAQAEVSMTLEQVFRLKQQRESIAAYIHSLLDDDPEIQFHSSVQPAKPVLQKELIPLVNQAVTNREVIREMEAGVSQARHAKNLAWLGYVPDLNLGFRYTWVGKGTTTDMDDGKDSWMFPLQISVPLWQNRILSEIGEAKKRVEEAEAKLVKAKNDTYYQVKDAYLRYQTAAKVVELYETAVIPQAKSALNSDQSGYEAGKVTFLELLDSERVYLNAKLSYLKIYNELLKSYADLERFVGWDVLPGEV